MYLSNYSNIADKEGGTESYYLKVTFDKNNYYILGSNFVGLKLFYT